MIQKAAALWESLSQNHAFVDGNKRVAVTMTAAFLRVNGFRLEFNDAEGFSFLLDLYQTGRMRFEEIERWLRQHVVAADQSAQRGVASGQGLVRPVGPRGVFGPVPQRGGGGDGKSLTELDRCFDTENARGALMMPGGSLRDAR